jgi:hypothetical protein
MNRVLKIFSTQEPEPEPLTQAECDQAARDALRRWGPLIDRHIRMDSPMGVQETQGALQRLTRAGEVEQGADGRYHLKGGR